MELYKTDHDSHKPSRSENGHCSHHRKQGQNLPQHTEATPERKKNAAFIAAKEGRNMLGPGNVMEANDLTTFEKFQQFGKMECEFMCPLLEIFGGEI